jgi:hypothetical protein
MVLGDVGHVESRFGPFGDMLILNQDRCTVCVKRSISSKINLDASNGTAK